MLLLWLSSLAPCMSRTRPHLCCSLHPRHQIVSPALSLPLSFPHLSELLTHRDGSTNWLPFLLFLWLACMSKLRSVCLCVRSPSVCVCARARKFDSHCLTASFCHLTSRLRGWMPVVLTARYEDPTGGGTEWRCRLHQHTGTLGSGKVSWLARGPVPFQRLIPPPPLSL